VRGGSVNNIYVSQSPLYSQKELIELYSFITKCKSFKKEPSELGAFNSGKKSKAHMVSWTDIKRKLSKFENFIYDANRSAFGYDIKRISDTDFINLNEYDSENNSYGWHIDGARKNKSHDLKLTCLLNISTDKYSGGNLDITPLDEETRKHLFDYFKRPGHALIFKSDRVHRVEPVTEGKRKTLSYWVKGPPWR
tara:strand:- start:62 stop:643 length:582 start_codon:yes stop_codon:yes gene_type:complete